MMKEQIEQRLATLKAEFEAGQKMLAELEAKQASVRDTMLRISGAMQVLEELLSVSQESEDNSTEIDADRNGSHVDQLLSQTY